MDFRNFTAGDNDEGRRFDRILKRMLPLQQGGSLYQALRKGIIRLNGKKADGNDHVHAGDTIAVASFLIDGKENISNCAHSDEFKFQTIFRNANIWVINKPYGIPVQPSEGCTACLSDFVAQEYARAQKSDSLSFRPGPLHRLDRYTTGVLAFSQSLLGAQWFTNAIAGNTQDDTQQTKQVQKTYIGLVQGNVLNEQHWVESIEDNEIPIQKFKTVTVNKLSAQSGSGERTAITDAYPLASGEIDGLPVTLIQFDITTGRKHQIRAQSSFHGFPLLGDTAYGGNACVGGRAFYLHAIRLIIQKDNPIGLPNMLCAEMDEGFKGILESSLINWDGRLIL